MTIIGHDIEIDKRQAVRLATIAVAVTLAAIRISGVKSQAFQAVAHLFVGCLIGAWWIGTGKDPQDWDGRDPWFSWEGIKERFYYGYGFYGWVALLISLVELFAFLWGRFVSA